MGEPKSRMTFSTHLTIALDLDRCLLRFHQPSEDGLATRHLMLGILRRARPGIDLADLNLDVLDQPTMVLPLTRQNLGDQPDADGSATKVLSAGNSESGLDAVDLLDDLFDGGEYTRFKRGQSAACRCHCLPGSLQRNKAVSISPMMYLEIARRRTLSEPAATGSDIEDVVDSRSTLMIWSTNLWFR